MRDYSGGLMADSGEGPGGTDPPPRPDQTWSLFETTSFPGFSPTHRAGRREPWEQGRV